MTRAEALRSIAENSRFVAAKFNDAFVMMEYFGYLRRDADAAASLSGSTNSTSLTATLNRRRWSRHSSVSR